MLSKKATIIKNLIAINASFLFIFASINSVASIQPVLNQEENLGVTSQVVIFAVQTVTCLVFPSIVLEVLGFKWTMALAELFFLSYIGFQALPTWYSLMPSKKKLDYWLMTMEFFLEKRLFLHKDFFDEKIRNILHS